jgi:hypothetical protein
MGFETTMVNVRKQCAVGLQGVALVNGDMYKMLPLNYRPQVDFSFITNLNDCIQIHSLCERVQANVLSALTELRAVTAVGREFHVEQL